MGKEVLAFDFKFRLWASWFICNFDSFLHGYICAVTHASCTVCYYMFMAQDSDPGAMNPVYNAHHNGEVPPPMPDYHPSQFGQGKVSNVIVDIILLSNEGSKQVILTIFRYQRFLVIPWNGIYIYGYIKKRLQ